MIMKKTIITILAASAVLVSCENEEIVQDNSSVSLSESVINAAP